MIYRGVILDIDNTLYAYAPCHAYALRESFLFLKDYLGLSEIEFAKEYDLARRKIHQRLAGFGSSHNRLLYFQAMLEKFNGDVLSLSYSAYEKYWQAYLRRLSLDPGARKLLKVIRNKQVCLLTDLTSDIQFRKVERLGLDRSLECSMVTSEEVGVEKPHPKMFKAALQKLKLSAKETIMVGDDWERDIVGAARLNIKSFWLVKHLKDYSVKIPSVFKRNIFICRNYGDIIRHLAEHNK